MSLEGTAEWAHVGLCKLSMTDAPALQQVDRTCVLLGSRKLSYFSGCDYFRLSSHPDVLRALREGTNRFGLNVAASRLTTGNHKLYLDLEKRLAEFFQTERAVLLSSGYAANIAVAQALSGTFSHVLLDERAHASLVDASEIFSCPIVRFRHRDPKQLADILQVIGKTAKPIILTDGMFAHDGSVAPVGAYLGLLPKDGVIVVDDAHAAGVLGANGRGTLEYLEISEQSRIIRTMTLSKAFGVYGGAILGSSTLQKRVLEKSRFYVGNTPMPLPLAAAALQALHILKTDRQLAARLSENVRYVKEELRQIRYPVEPTPSPIIPLLPETQREIGRLKRLFLAQRVFPPWIKYPGGPPLGYFRLALSSEHTKKQLDDFLRIGRGWWLER